MSPVSASPAPASASPDDGSPAAEDRELMDRVREGDEAALGRLMERWERPVKAVIGRLVGNAAEAEELAQEAFVRLWQQRERFRPGAEFRPWMLALAVNLARNRLRWWRRRPVISLDAWSGHLSVAGGGGTPEELEASERAEAVRAAVAALPADQREALVLFEYEELAQAEIAAIVGASPKAVERRLDRARAELRQRLARWLRRA